MVHGGETILDRPTLVVAGGQLALPCARARRRSSPTAGSTRRGRYCPGARVGEPVRRRALRRARRLDPRRGRERRGTAHGVWNPGAGPAIARDQICAPSPHDGVLECRVALQPELARSLRDLARAQLDPAVRVAYVALRGDTGEILAQGVTRGDDALAYPPIDEAARAALVALRDAPGESPRERPEWNLPIAVGSTVKPVLARAAELAFPGELAGMELAAVVPGAGCKARRGKGVAPIVGHCPPTSLAGQPERADVHDFLARSPNWFQAALGVIGLGLGPGARTMRRDGEPIDASSVLTSDLSAWSANHRLTIDDVLTSSSIAMIRCARRRCGAASRPSSGGPCARSAIARRANARPRAPISAPRGACRSPRRRRISGTWSRSARRPSTSTPTIARTSAASPCASTSSSCAAPACTRSARSRSWRTRSTASSTSRPAKATSPRRGSPRRSPDGRSPRTRAPRCRASAPSRAACVRVVQPGGTASPGSRRRCSIRASSCTARRPARSIARRHRAPPAGVRAVERVASEAGPGSRAGSRRPTTACSSSRSAWSSMVSRSRSRSRSSSSAGPGRRRAGRTAVRRRDRRLLRRRGELSARPPMSRITSSWRSLYLAVIFAFTSPAVLDDATAASNACR